MEAFGIYRHIFIRHFVADTSGGLPLFFDCQLGFMEEMRPLPPDLKEEAHLMELESMGYTIVSVRSHCLLRWRASVAAR